MSAPIARPLWSMLRALLALLGIAVLTAFVARADSPISPSGEGAGAAGGYEVGAVEYTLLASDPSRIGGIDLEVTAAGSGVPARQVMVSIDGGADWTACRPAGGADWTCPVGATVRELDELRVIATQ